MDHLQTIQAEAMHQREGARLFFCQLVERLPPAEKQRLENLHFSEPGSRAVVEIDPAPGGYVAVLVVHPDGRRDFVARFTAPLEHIRSCECSQCLVDLEQRFPGFGDFAKAMRAAEPQPARQSWRLT